MLAVCNVHNATVELHSAHATQPHPVQNFFLERCGQAFANVTENFIKAVENGTRDPKPGGFDGLQAQILAEAAAVSWQTGRPVNV